MSTFEITFTTTTSGMIKSIDMVFPAGFIVSITKLIEKSGIGEGAILTSNSPNGPMVTYTVTSPVNIAAGIPIRFELANIQNANTAGNTHISITSKSPTNIIDGPTSSTTTLKQIATADIANGAVTRSKIAQNSVQILVTERPSGMHEIAPGY